MAIVTTRPGPNGRARPSLGDQLDRLDEILNGLSDALNESVTAAVSAAVGQAVREAMESATREMAAGCAPGAAGPSRPEGIPEPRPSQRPTGRFRSLSHRVFAQAGRATGRLLLRLGRPLVASAREVARAPLRFAGVALAGILAGTTVGVGGPLIGAALGTAAGFAFALRATRPS
jgi:hypothetical protein